MQTIRFETPIGLPALTGAHGYLASRGNYIAWQFDDCEWAPHLLQTLLGAAAAAPEAGLIYGRAYYPDETRDGLLGGLITRAELETGRNVIPNCVTLVPRHVHETLGWLDPHILLKRNCDWDMWTRIAGAFPLRFVEETLATEYGLCLPDSLGRSVGVEEELMLRYSRLNRRNSLLPTIVRNYSPFQLPPGFDLPLTEAEALAALVVQHFARIGRPGDALTEVAGFAPQLVERWRTAPVPAEPGATIAALAWAGQRTLENANKRLYDRQVLLDDRLRIIKDERALLDERYAIITDLRDQLMRTEKATSPLFAMAARRLHTLRAFWQSSHRSS